MKAPGILLSSSVQLIRMKKNDGLYEKGQRIYFYGGNLKITVVCPKVHLIN